MQQVHRRGGQPGPLVAPVHQRDVDRKQRAALGSQPVLVQVARGVRGVVLPLQNAVLNEPVEAVGEHITSQSDPALEVLESPGPVERLPQDHPHPAFPHDGR